MTPHRVLNGTKGWDVLFKVLGIFVPFWMWFVTDTLLDTQKKVTTFEIKIQYEQDQIDELQKLHPRGDKGGS